MSDEIARLNEIADFLRDAKSKVKLIGALGSAKAAYEKYDFQSAEKILKEAYEIDSKNSSVLRGLGCVYLADADFENSLLYFKKALEESTAKEVEYSLIGTVYYFWGKFDESLDYFNMAIEINENYEPAYKGRNQVVLENHINILELQDMLKKYF